LKFDRICIFFKGDKCYLPDCIGCFLAMKAV
jgi:hypothetical protein